MPKKKQETKPAPYCVQTLRANVEKAAAIKVGGTTEIVAARMAAALLDLASRGVVTFKEETP